MARIITTENAKVVREYVSPVTTIHWDPLNNTGVLVYSINELLFINDVFVQSTGKTSVSIPLSDVVAKNYDVEVAPGVFQTVPGGLIMLAFKKAFEDAITDGLVQLGDDPVSPPPPTEEPTV